MFDRISIHQEKNIKMKAKIINAMVYPMIVLAIATLVFITLFIGVVPHFEKFFLDATYRFSLFKFWISFITIRQFIYFFKKKIPNY